MHAFVTSYSGTTLVVNVDTVEGTGGPFTAWTINVGGLLTAQGALLEVNNLSDVSNPATALTNIGGVPTSRTISAGTGLTGGGDLTANRTLTVSYGTTSGTACQGNDARLSDSRTPLSHTHGNLTNAGAIGTTANLPLKTGSGGVVEAGSFSNTAGSFCAGDDVRLSNARTPTAHAASHSAGSKASYNDQLAGMSTNVFIRAVNVGTAGNSITLTFDGVDDIDTVLAAWNTANTSNTAELVSGDGSQIPDDLEEITLSGGGAVGSDPIFDQDLNTDNSVTFEQAKITKLLANAIGPRLILDNTAGYGEGAVDFYTIGEANSDTDNPSARWYVVDDGNYSAHQYFQTKETGSNGVDMITRLSVRTDGNVGIGVEQPNTTLDVAGNIALRDTDNEFAATFDVQNQLSDDVTLTIPDQSGTLAVVDDLPTEVTDLAATGISADYVPVAQGDGTIVWEAQSGGGGGDTVSIETTAADILSVASGAISADDAGADRIVYWNNTSNKLAYGTPSDVGAAASGSITTSGLTQATARILGRTSASTGAIEEIQIGSGLSLSAGELSATGGSGVTAVGPSTDDVLSVSGSDLVADDAGADRIIFWDDSESKLRYLEAGSGLSISGTTMTVTATGGATNLWIPASAWIPKTTAGCGVDSRETTTNDQNFDELLFDAGSDELADALVVMPSNYNNGTITARFYWTAASGSGGVAWGIQGRAFANDDALDTAAGTAQLVTDTLIAANDMHITSATSAVTIGGTPAANTPIQFSIYRDVSDAADNLAVDARLLGVEIIFN
jgi:hypothetical protein